MTRGRVGQDGGVREQFLTVESARPARSIQLCYEVIEGDLGPTAPTALLVMGLGLDMLWWRDDFCAELVRRGIRVVRFDNRDVGRSTRLDGPGASTVQYFTRRAPTAYSLEEMADDTAALIAEVAPHGAHVVGVSLGSMIAQAAAVRHPEQVLSLVSIMGRPGDRRSGKMAKRMALERIRPAPADAVEALVRTFHRIGSSGRTPADDDDVREIMARSAIRGDDTGGGRQLAAIVDETDRTPGLRSFAKPALVIHGDRDRVILPSGGRATAAALPGSELLVLRGMGHDLARRLWPEVLDGIERTIRRAEAG
jgi:pimeloyl-ACP methyl ester carboxylesterase